MVRRDLTDTVRANVVAAEFSKDAHWAVDVLNYDEVAWLIIGRSQIGVVAGATGVQARRVLVKHRRMLLTKYVLPERFRFLPCLVEVMGGAQARKKLESGMGYLME